MTEAQFHMFPSVDIAQPHTIGAFCVLGEPSEQKGILSIGPHATLRSHTVIYSGSTIGSHFQTGHGVLIREHCSIGNHVSVGSHSVLEHHVTIGDGVRIHSNVFLPEFTVIENEVWIGPGVVVTNARYPNATLTKQKLAGVTIKRGAKIGAGAVLLPGVTVGESALVGAGAIVTQDVEPHGVYVGVPAKKVRNVTQLRWDTGEVVYE